MSIRPTVQTGNCHRLSSPQDGERVALEYVAPDSSEAVLFLYNRREPVGGGNPEGRRSLALRLRGLDSKSRYSLSGDLKLTASGESLANLGIPWFVKGDSASAVVIIKRQ